MSAELATKRLLIFSAAGCLVPTALGISGVVCAEGAADSVQAGAPLKKAARRATVPTMLWPELRLSRELGTLGTGEKASSGSSPELPAALSESQAAAVASGRIPLPVGDVSRAGIVPASRMRLRDGSLILEADATDKR